MINIASCYLKDNISHFVTPGTLLSNNNTNGVELSALVILPLPYILTTLLSKTSQMIQQCLKSAVHSLYLEVKKFLGESALGHKGFHPMNEFLWQQPQLVIHSFYYFVEYICFVGSVTLDNNL